MKSYLRFLSRNKLYTAIEIVGLSIALAFVIVLSSYIVNDMSVNKVLKNTDDIYLVHREDRPYIYDEVPTLYGMMPEIMSSCSMVQSGRQKSLFDGVTTASCGENNMNVSILGVSETFFDFFTFPLSEGSPDNALSLKNNVVISEEMAQTLFPDGDVIGKEINLFEKNPQSAYDPDISDFNVNLVVTGIFKSSSKTTFITPDLIMRYDLVMEQQYAIFHDSMRMAELSFVRIDKGTDIVPLAENLKNEFLKVAKNYAKETFNPNLTFTKFDDIKKQDPEIFGDFVFDNIRHGKLYNIYLLMCIFITVVSLLDYIVLTIAFSRFRIKEIATRQLLGTDRSSIIARCFAETLLLLAVSCFFAVLIAVAFKTQASQILGAEINPLTQLSEYLILAGLVLLMVAIASAVPSLILSSYSAIEVIKGETRYRDKVTFGKIFIGFAGFLSILAMSICFGVTSQTKHLINQPLGYNMDGIVYIELADENHNIVYDKLQAESYVDNVGMISGLPAGGYSMTSIKNGKGERERAYLINGTDGAREILGIEIIEDFNITSGNSQEEKFYMTQSSYENGEEYIQDGNLKMYRRKPLNGIVKDFKIGTLKQERTGKLTLFSITDIETLLEWGGSHIVKVNIDENKAKHRICEMLKNMGYSEDLYHVCTLREFVEKDIVEEKNMMKLLIGFSLICILMTLMTIVGLSSYQSKTAEKDNAIRNVFGCGKKELIRKAVFDFTLPIALSAVIAVPIAYTVIGRWLEGYVIRTNNSPIIYIGAFTIVLVVVLAAILLQTLRLMRTNPAEALKKE